MLDDFDLGLDQLLQVQASRGNASGPDGRSHDHHAANHHGTSDKGGYYGLDQRKAALPLPELLPKFPVE